GHGQPMAPRNNWLGLGLVGIVEVLASLPTNLDSVTEPLGGNHRCRRIGALNKCVGGSGRAVDQGSNLLHRQLGLFDDLQNTQCPVVLGRQYLGSYALLALFFPGKQISKSAANVNANTPHELTPLFVNQLLPTSLHQGKGRKGTSKTKGSAMSIPKLCVGQSFCVGAALCGRPPPGNHIGLPLRLLQRFLAMSSRRYECFCFLLLCTTLA